MQVCTYFHAMGYLIVILEYFAQIFGIVSLGMIFNPQ